MRMHEHEPVYELTAKLGKVIKWWNMFELPQIYDKQLAV